MESEYHVETLKKLIKLAKDRVLPESEMFLVEVLESQIPEKDFQKFLKDTGLE